MEEKFHTFSLLMANINRSIRRIKSEETAEFDLKGPHASCLYYLYKEKSVTSKKLCELCETDKAGISRSIDFLEHNGYLQKRIKKRYKSPIELTERGREVAAKIAEKIDGIFAAIAEGLSEEQRRTMYEALETISLRLREVCDCYHEKAERILES